MADPVVLTKPAIYLGGYEITGDLNNLGLVTRHAELDDTRFGDVADSFFPGRMAADSPVSGFYRAGSLSPDEIANLRILASSPNRAAWPLTLSPNDAPSDGGTDGNLAYVVHGAQFSYRIGAQHGQSLPFELTTRTRGEKVYRATIMLAKASRNATATGTARQLGTVAATQKVVSVLHAFEVTGASGSVTVTVESDNAVTFLSAATRITHAAVATAGTPATEVLSAAGPITDDWWRVVATWTAGTAYTVAGLLAIVPA